jgi:hypothetical protein
VSDFQKGQIVGVRLTGASVIKTTTLLGLSRTAFFKVMTDGIQKSWEDISS